MYIASRGKSQNVMRSRIYKASWVLVDGKMWLNRDGLDLGNRMEIVRGRLRSR